MNVSDGSTIAGRFNAAAAAYEGAARVQAESATLLATRIRAAFADKAPRRILEFGCGTGLLTSKIRAMFPDAELTVTDIAPLMLEQTASRVGHHATHYALMDANDAHGANRYDLICSNFAMQWLSDRATALAKLAALLTPGGRLMVTTLAEGSFAEWRRACALSDVPCGFPVYPSARQLQKEWPFCGSGAWDVIPVYDRVGSGLAFLRDLKRIGAATPHPAAVPTGARLRAAIHNFDARATGTVTYQVAIGCFRRSCPLPGVFVTGTDTGVGKTLASACLTQAWNATYWKPLQSGLADEPGDTDTVMNLAGVPPSRMIPPAYALQASLSPLDAARAEGMVIDPARLALPDRVRPPLVIEGAGGLLVPASEHLMMIDLIALYGMPVVLVARSGLGTINHTLLSLEALKNRGIEVAGVLLVGPINEGNRAAIAQRSNVRILAEIPWMDEVNAASISNVAATIPIFDSISRR
ncbi:dethiobiotin synthase [Brytella acorum]|uniref:ATP-dependent dethiobiotin synthetase BioD n=1 Tax=Brytella acorum TaxID=2959299 RepID=A0AA35Y2Y3_9PROT|nr:dethiobiotin synthase [Brytella acorum]MDF3625442.1 dethiobiotin synthase [Brytella acorum]CAI9120293.1 dethiobiotin synthase [Brytella acorum]